MLEERKLKKKGKNTSIFLLRHQIVTLPARANQIDDELSEEHQTFFNKSIEELTFRVGEGRKFTWIRQAEQYLFNYVYTKNLALIAYY